MRFQASECFTVEEKVDYFDCDNRNNMRISAAIRCTQRCSCEQMIRLGIPLEKLLAEGMSLILTKMCIKVHRIPVRNERLIVGTIPVNAVGAKYHRDYFLDSSEGEPLISVFSYWILIDPETKKLIRPSKFPCDLDLRPSLALDNIIGDVPFPKRSVPEDVRAAIPVRYSDIDWNDHVNNTIYADFVCDALLDEIREGKRIGEFSICFKNASLLGDVIKVSSAAIENDGRYLVGQHDRGVCFEALVRFDG